MFWLWIATAVALVMLALCVVAAARCPAGWKPWVCYQLGVCHAALFYHWRAANRSTIPEHGPALIVSNHTSPVDPVILWIRHFAEFQKPRLRLIAYMVAREYVIRRDPVGWVCRAMRSIPVAREGKDMAAVQAALRRLEQGELLGVFPEGRLNAASPDEQLLPGGTGVGWLALKSGVPVIPIFIRNAPRSDSMVMSFFRRTSVEVIYGDPIDLSSLANRRLTHVVVAEATNRIMKSLADLGGIRFTPVASEAKLREPVTSRESREI